MKKAFTLVELLVAVLLLTLLIGTALFSYRQVLLNIKKTQASTFNEVLKVHQIRTSIESMQHYIVDEYNQLDMPMKKLHPFFLGTDKYFIYITQSPIFSHIPSLARFDCIDNGLKYTEEPLYKRINFKKPHFLDDSTSNIYWKDISSCNIEYFLLKKRFTELKDSVPSAVEITFLDSNEVKHTIFSSIKSDYNISKGVIYEYLYGE